MAERPEPAAEGAAPPTRRRALLLLPLGLTVVAGAGFWGMLRGMRNGTYDPRGVPSALIGKSAPPSPLTEIPGLDVPPSPMPRCATPGAPCW